MAAERTGSHAGLAALVLACAVAFGGCSGSGSPASTTPAAPSTPTSPAPAPSGAVFSLSGTVRDQETGAGLSGAVVQIVGGENANQKTTTTADGSYALSGLAPQTATFQVTADSHVSVTRTATISADTRLDVMLSASARTISGVVTDATSHGVLPNILIQIDQSSARTDGAGAYSITGLGTSALTLTASAEGYVTATRTIDAGSSTHVDLVLSREAPKVRAISGVVTDATSHGGVSNAAIAITGAGTSVSGRTDSSGAYRIDGAGVGTLTVTASADGYSNAVSTVAAGTADARADLVLARVTPNGRTISGVVTDAVFGGRTSNILIQITGSGPTLSVRTDVNGAYRIDGASLDALTVTASIDIGYLTATKSVPAGTSNVQVDFALQPILFIDLGFDGVGANGAPFVASGSRQFDVRPISGPWYINTSQGAPAPAIELRMDQSSSHCASGVIEVTASGTPFSFSSWSYSVQSNAGGVTYTGFRNGQQVFSELWLLINDGAWHPTNGVPTATIDRLQLGVNGCTSPIRVDNITLTYKP